MFDFFDMPSLSAVLQSVTEELDEGNVNAAIDFTRQVLSVDVPHTTTPLYCMYTEENAVIRYAQQFLKLNQELGIDHAVDMLAQHTSLFDYADSPMLTTEAVTKVLNKVCKVFPYAEKVIGNNPIEIMLIEAQHETRNNESTAIFTPNGMQASICVYQLQGYRSAAPEHILLHELGHLLHMKATGTITDVPASFVKYLSQLGTDCVQLTTTQLQEIFADTFMLAVISQTPIYGDPLPQIPIAAKQTCLRYIKQLLNEMTDA